MRNTIRLGVTGWLPARGTQANAGSQISGPVGEKIRPLLLLLPQNSANFSFECYGTESLETLNRICDPEKKVLFVYKGHRWTFSTRPQVQVPGVRSRWVEIVALAGLAAWLLGVTKRLQHFSHFCFGHTCALSCARHFWISFPCENVFYMKAPKIAGLLFRVQPFSLGCNCFKVSAPEI